MSIRAVPVAALMIAGLAASASAQMMGPGMYMPGQAPFQQQQRPQEPPCLKDFAPIKAEAEKRGVALKKAMEAKNKPSREEACNMFKGYSAAEAKVVKFIVDNSKSCGIPPEAATAMKANHQRTMETQNKICTAGPGGAPHPTGPGLSEALGTTRIPGTTLDPLAPQSGTFDTLTGNILSK
jgi:hypothetical protein